MNIVYFQPKNINPKYCERGTIHKDDPEYILAILNRFCRSYILFISEL